MTIRPLPFVVIQWSIILEAVVLFCLGHVASALILFVIGLIWVAIFLIQKGRPPRNW